MKQRIMNNIGFLVALSMLLTFTAASVIMYEKYNSYMRQDVKNEVEYIRYAIEKIGEEYLTEEAGNLTTSRITLTAPDGTVLYDSEQYADQGENRTSSPGFEKVQEDGTGEVMRYSESLSQQTYYYAVKLNSGNILGVAKTTESVFHTMFSSFALMGILLLAILALGFCLMERQTKKLIEPINQLDLEHPLEHVEYEELRPLLNRVDQQNRQIAQQVEELRQAETVRREFSANVSHELKTPITIIKGQLEGMLLGIGAYKDHEKYLARSLEVAATLETMVQEILTISRLETNVDFKMEHFDCAPMIHGYLREIDDLVATKELQIHLAIQSPAFINGNKLLIEKVFSNLISNAVKYSPHGASVDIILQNTNGRFLFSVENTGTHIPEDDIPKLFDAFYRMEQSRSRRTGGSGLGLYMVQRILQQHNSYCEACNTENGVKFFFTI